jgi:hypothetical protein
MQTNPEPKKVWKEFGGNNKQKNVVHYDSLIPPVNE